jgi:hypothetical protein
MVVESDDKLGDVVSTRFGGSDQVRIKSIKDD